MEPGSIWTTATWISLWMQVGIVVNDYDHFKGAWETNRSQGQIKGVDEWSNNAACWACSLQLQQVSRRRFGPLEQPINESI